MPNEQLDILGALSESITLRMKTVLDPTHYGYWVENKVHSDYDIWFLQSGALRITINGKEHLAKPGDAILFYPDIPYMATSNSKGCHFIYVHFDFGIGTQPRLLNDLMLSGIIPSELLAEETLLFSNAYHHTPENRLYLKACLSAIIAKIIDLNRQERYAGGFLSGPKTKKSEQSLDLLQPVFAYIHEHLHKSLTMSELASLVSFSEKYFITFFKKALGITPGQYMYQIRMNRAREYLYMKKYSIQQIASLLGYPDAFSFSKAFKKYYHVPPSKFE
ncbi:AraC family transcriptional regulator [Paenibacillus sp. HB172176]|uniref:helix-turn-helix transcriptional regulator n=1 Tax=Paenibacillus sp. HB172176 TaxID=2493690 RepID=UPI001438CB0E|nr:AraC family transcriptional regulator [Paenibacillus sp. HB172176]